MRKPIRTIRPFHFGSQSARLSSNTGKSKGVLEKKPDRPRSANACINSNFIVFVDDWFAVRSHLHEKQDHSLCVMRFEPRRQFGDMLLSHEALKILILPNAGGNSIVSEVLSYELLKKCFGAVLMKTEMEVEYFPMGGSITDYVVKMDNVKMGVSVTRAMKYGHAQTLSVDEATHLLMKKLNGVNQSNRNSLEKWHKQILHVWADGQHAASAIKKAYKLLNKEIKSDTLVLVTIVANCPDIFVNSR